MFDFGGAMLLLFFLIVIGLPVVCVTLIILAAIIRPGFPRRRGAIKAADETRLIQEIHHGLAKMETRIEALETIILTQEQRKEATS